MRRRRIVFRRTNMFWYQPFFHFGVRSSSSSSSNSRSHNHFLYYFTSHDLQICFEFLVGTSVDVLNENEKKIKHPITLIFGFIEPILFIFGLIFFYLFQLCFHIFDERKWCNEILLSNMPWNNTKSERVDLNCFGFTAM